MPFRISRCLLRQIVIGLALVFAGQAVHAQERSDRVRILGGGTASGRIVEISPNEVTVESRGSVTRVPANKIDRIVFAGMPFAMQRVPQLVNDGQYENAMRELERINRNDIGRSEAQVDYDYLVAISQAKLAVSTGDGLVDAVKQLVEFINKNTKSYHFYPAQEALGDLAMALQKYSAAARSYGQLRKAPWPEYQLRGSILEANALVAQQDYKAALAIYESVAGSAQSTVEATRQKNLAVIGRAVCQAELGSPKQGVADVGKLINDNSSSDVELFSRAYNALGACYRKLGRPKEAIYEYLKVDTLFARQADAHAEALYYLSVLWPQINRPARGEEARRTLRERYSGSRWAAL